jgi:two-component system, cell cycle response regulator DivK
MSNKTVLIIEDNEQNLYLMRFLLEKNGFVVSDATDGLKGIEAARTLLPDLILLDIQLPGMDGYAVAIELRRNAALQTTPIIAVTSYAMVGDRERALGSGATDYIEKPINPFTFVEQVRRHLETHAGNH